MTIFGVNYARYVACALIRRCDEKFLKLELKVRTKIILAFTPVLERH